MFHWSLLSVALLTLALSAALRREKPRDEIIVARFNEDLSWLEKYKGDYDITVYNKGPNSAGNFKQIKLPNVGNESHTYLWHIVNRYDSLAPRTVFLVGSSEKITWKKEKMDILFKYINEHNKSEFRACCHEVGNLKTHQYGFQIDEYEKTSDENKQVLDDRKLDPSPERPFGKWYEENFGDYVSPYACYNSIFAVTREDIRRKPKSYYQNLLEKYFSKGIHPEAVHYIERAWYAVFYS
jgi:hypothetical protein